MKNIILIRSSYYKPHNLKTLTDYHLDPSDSLRANIIIMRHFSEQLAHEIKVVSLCNCNDISVSDRSETPLTWNLGFSLSGFSTYFVYILVSILDFYQEMITMLPCEDLYWSRSCVNLSHITHRFLVRSVSESESESEIVYSIDIHTLLKVISMPVAFLQIIWGDYSGFVPNHKCKDNWTTKHNKTQTETNKQKRSGFF